MYKNKVCIIKKAYKRGAGVETLKNLPVGGREWVGCSSGRFDTGEEGAGER
jgi:hypothetical protein